MEEKDRRELKPEEIDKVSGGFDNRELSDGKCPGCKKPLEHIAGSEYWCTNKRCWAYHIRKNLAVIA